MLSNLRSLSRPQMPPAPGFYAREWCRIISEPQEATSLGPHYIVLPMRKQRENVQGKEKPESLWKGHGVQTGGRHSAEGTGRSFQFAELPLILQTSLVARNNTQRSLPYVT